MTTVEPGAVEGAVVAPPSKSVMVRAVAASTLAAGHSTIENASLCDDALAALRIAAGMGASLRVGDAPFGPSSHNGWPDVADLTTARSGRLAGDLVIAGAPPEPPGSDLASGESGPRVLDCGESALCLRLFAPLAALRGEPVQLTGRGSLLGRPMGMVEHTLSLLGVRCRSTHGRPPVTLAGRLGGADLELDGSVTSQLLSGLLMGLPRCARDSTLHVHALRSPRYVALTLRVMEHFGVTVEHDAALSRFTVAGRQRYRPAAFTVEGDYSGAALLLVAGAVAGRVEVGGLRPDSLQPDRAVLAALERAGAGVESSANAVAVARDELRAFELDATDCPDLFPPLAALACHCSGTTVLHGAGRLRHKESDRARALCQELGKMGADIELHDDALHVRGTRLRGATIDAHGDHRIAMACAVAALAADGAVVVRDAECVAKSYPTFFDDLRALGAKIS